jgi:LysM repeat protein
VLKESDLSPDGKKQMIISPELRRLKDKLESSRLLAQRESLPNQKSKVLEPSITAAPSQLQATDKQPLQEPSPMTDGWLSRYQPHKTPGYPLVFIGNVAIERIQHQNGMLTGIIRVEVEETLGHYAEWSKVTAAEIRRLNGIRYGQMIRIDQHLKIPLHRVTSEEFEENRFEYHRELSEDFFATYRVESVQTYTIKKGDNIWKLSREEFEVPLWLIRRYNMDVDFYKLMPSQKLLIPVVEKRFQIPT